MAMRKVPSGKALIISLQVLFASLCCANNISESTKATAYTKTVTDSTFNADFDAFEHKLRMPSRYPIDPVDTRDMFFIETGAANKEYPIWHAPYPAAGTLWPQPKHESRNAQLLRLNLAAFAFELAGKSNDILTQAIKRYRDIIVEQKAVSVLFEAPKELTISKAPMQSVSVKVEKDGGEYPHLNMDESYRIEILPTGKATISAAETWGALRAFETFVQLVVRSPPTSSDDLLYVVATTIDDAPRFRYRGLMVDTARHFISKHTLLRNLEAMAINKLNVFHWHIVDDSSFPFESRAWPDLSKRGAYDAERMIYTHADVREIVEFARLRGIRVVPEFDMPGHTHSWGRGYPKLLTPCYRAFAAENTQVGPSPMANAQTKADTDPNLHQGLLDQNMGQKVSANTFKIGDMKYEFDGHFGPMDPSKNFTFEFIEKLFDEVAELFPDEYLHIGGDESGKMCWVSNPRVKSMINDKNINPHQLYMHFMAKVYKIMKDIGVKHNKKVKAQVWHEAVADLLTPYRQTSKEFALVPNDTLVEIWQTYPSPKSAIDAGFDTIYSACWYLDYQKQGVSTQWIGFYKCDAVFEQVAMSGNSHFLGGEACMWNEWQDDQSVLTRIWPLALAPAERLWSHIAVDQAAAAKRIEAQRCRMTARGIPVGVAGGSGSCPYFTDRHDMPLHIPQSPHPDAWVAPVKLSEIHFSEKPHRFLVAVIAIAGVIALLYGTMKRISARQSAASGVFLSQRKLTRIAIIAIGSLLTLYIVI